MEKLSFNEQIEQSIKDNWDLDALSDYKGETFQYKDIARIIEKLHIIFEYSNVKPGDKIALCGRNSPLGSRIFCDADIRGCGRAYLTRVQSRSGS